MPQYNTLIYIDENALGVESGATINIKTGGKIVANGTQASAITDATAATGGDAPTEAEYNALVTKLNAALAALRGVGIIA